MLLWNWCQVIFTGSHWWQVNIGSGNGLLPPGNKPLYEPVLTETERLRDWDKFIQHKMTLYRCMISDIHDSSYVLFSTNLISHTSLHVGRPLLRPFLVAYAEATLARQKKIAQQTKSVDIISEYLLWTNGQLFEMNVKIVSSYWQAGKAFDPLQHD